MNEDKFEYDVLYRPLKESYTGFVNTTLDEAGQKGWENYAIVDTQWFFMKRKISNQSCSVRIN